MRYSLKILIVLIVLTAANIFSLYPFSVNLKDSAPDNPDDVLLNSYIMQWEYEHILSFDLSDYFNTSYYYPYKNTLAFTEHHTISQVFFIPLYTLIRDSVFVHNIMILLLLILSGLTTFIFIHYLTSSFLSSLLGAVLFTFVPYRYTHLVHLNVIHWWIIPVVFLTFYIFSVRISPKNALVFGLSVLALVLWSNNMTAFFIVPFFIYALFTGISSGAILKPRFYLYLSIILVSVVILSAPFLWHYIKLRNEMFFERFLFDIRYYSPQLKNLLGVSETNLFWGKWLGKYGKWECFLFPGTIFIMLFLISNLTLFVNKYRRYILLFSFIAILTLLLSLGPYLDGLEGDTRGPYYLLWKFMPGYYGIRVPTRFAIFAYFSMAVVSALFAAGISERLKDRKTFRVIFSSAVLLFTILFIFEGSHRPELHRPLNHPERDPVYSKLKKMDYGVVFEYPAFAAYKDAAHVFATLYHRKPTVNGYSGWNSKPLENLRDAVNTYHPRSLIRFMRDMNIRYFVLRGNVPSDIYNRVSKLDEYDKGVKKVFTNFRDILFQLDDAELNEFDFYKTELSGKEFYIPSCIRNGERINGGIIIKESNDRFSFSHRRRYPVYLDFISRGNGKISKVSSDIVAYRVYEPGNIHLLIKFKADLPEGLYAVRLNNLIIKESVKLSPSCPYDLSENIELTDIDLPDRLNEGEPLKVEFRIRNNEKYLKAAVDIDDFTTDGVFRVAVFLWGLDEENQQIRYEQRYPIYSDMSQGDVLHFRQYLPFFLKEGRYKLRVDCVSEKRFWFSSKGSCGVEKEIVVGKH